MHRTEYTICAPIRGIRAWFDNSDILKNWLKYHCRCRATFKHSFQRLNVVNSTTRAPSPTDASIPAEIGRSVCSSPMRCDSNSDAGSIRLNATEIHPSVIPALHEHNIVLLCRRACNSKGECNSFSARCMSAAPVPDRVRIRQEDRRFPVPRRCASAHQGLTALKSIQRLRDLRLHLHDRADKGRMRHGSHVFPACMIPHVRPFCAHENSYRVIGPIKRHHTSGDGRLLRENLLCRQSQKLSGLNPVPKDINGYARMSLLCDHLIPLVFESLLLNRLNPYVDEIDEVILTRAEPHRRTPADSRRVINDAQIHAWILLYKIAQ